MKWLLNETSIESVLRKIYIATFEYWQLFIGKEKVKQGTHFIQNIFKRKKTEISNQVISKDELDGTNIELTTDITSVPPPSIVSPPDTPNLNRSSEIVNHQTNLYYLPWIMANLILDPKIKQNYELKTELETITLMFESWNPKTKAFKELKKVFAPIKSNL